MSIDTQADVRALIDHEPIGSGQYLAFGLLLLTLSIDGLDIQVTSYLAPAIAKEWHVSMANLGLIFSVGLAGTALGALALGALGDALGLKRIILMATLVIAIATIGMSFTTSVGQLVALRFLAGIGVGGTLPNLMSLGSQLAPGRRRATVITIICAGFPIGATLAGVCAASLLVDQGWRTVYVAAGLFPLALVPLSYLFLPESIPSLLRRKGGQAAVGKILQRLYPKRTLDGPYSWSRANVVNAKIPIAEIFRHGRAPLSLAMSFIFFFSLMNVYLLSNWLPTLLQQAHSTAHQSIVVTTVFNLGGIFGALLLGRLIDRFGYWRVLSTVLLCASGCLFLLGSGGFSYRELLATALLGGFIVLGGQGGVNALPALIYPDDLRATASGWAIGTGRLGSVVGPMLVGGLLSAQWTYGEVLKASSVIPLFAAALLLVIAKMVIPDHSAVPQR